MTDTPKPNRRSVSAPSETELGEERELLRRCRSGDHEAFSMIVARYRDQVYAVAYRFTGCPETSRDLSQDAFVKAWTKLDRFDVQRSFRPWMLRITRNVVIDHMRKTGLRREVSLDELHDEHHVEFDTQRVDASGAPGKHGSRRSDPRENIYRGEMRGHLGAALAELSPAHREIIMLFHEQELSYQEIAETLDVPVGTVMSRLFNARRAMRRAMEQRLGEEEVAT